MNPFSEPGCLPTLAAAAPTAVKATNAAGAVDQRAGALGTDANSGWGGRWNDAGGTRHEGSEEATTRIYPEDNRRQDSAASTQSGPPLSKRAALCIAPGDRQGEVNVQGPDTDPRSGWVSLTEPLIAVPAGGTGEILTWAISAPVVDETTSDCSTGESCSGVGALA